MNLRRFQAILRKEVFHLVRDFRSLYLAFAIPLLLILLFGYALSLDVDHVKAVVVDYDKTDLSRDFVRSFGASPYFDLQGYYGDMREIDDALDQGRISLAIVIPSQWSSKIRADREAPLQILLDGSDPNFANITRGYINAFVERYNSQLLVDFLNRQGLEPIQPPVEGRIRVWFNEDLESRQFIIPGIIAVIIMIVGAMLTSLVVAREYENGTMETIRSLPVSALEFLAGKTVPYFAIGIADVLIAVLMGQMLFGIVMKASFWLMILASSLYLAVALFLGLLISSVTKSQFVANQMAILLTFLPSMLLSNFVFPAINMPKILQFVTYLVPATYYIDILSGIYLRDLDLIHLLPSFAVLAMMALILMALNMAILRKEGL
jgi:ABC-2 type transport system permease protein